MARRLRPKRRRLATAQTFFRDYTRGLNTRDLKRLFDRDAAHAYSVLTREHADLPEPTKRGRRLLFRARLAFLGLSYKLSPARRLLFAVGLLAFPLGMCTGSITFQGAHRIVTIDFSPIWFMVSSGALVFLLALELVDRVMVRDELQVARELQAELLPQKLTPVPGYAFAHSYRTANEVGGDYYDISLLPDGRLALLVGDASGHGMAAGLVMAIANATLKTAFDIDPSPERVAALLNRTLCRTGTRRTFMTVFYALLQPATGDIEAVCAGHPFPIVVRRDRTSVELGQGGLPLGMKDPLPLAVQHVTLAPGDLLVLFTDGLPEVVGPSGESFGYDRLAQIGRAGGSAQEVHDRILQAFLAHVGDEPLRDDMTLLVVARLATAG